METKTEVQHTPTPWHLRNDSTEIAYSDGELVSYIAGVHVATICPEHGTPESNAAFIVKACNAYDNDQKKIKAYRRIVDALKEWTDLGKMPKCASLMPDRDQSFGEAITEAIQQAGE